MEKAELQLILSTIRRAWNRYPERYKALNRCKVRYGIYRCEECQEEKRKRDIQVDHISPVVPVTGFEGIESHIRRLFCKAELLKVLCKPCHNAKSFVENTKRRRIKQVAKELARDLHPL